MNQNIDHQYGAFELKGPIKKLSTIELATRQDRLNVRSAALSNVAQAARMYPQAVETFKPYEAPKPTPVDAVTPQQLNYAEAAQITSVEFQQSQSTVDAAPMTSVDNPLFAAQTAVAQAYNNLGQEDVAKAA